MSGGSEAPNLLEAAKELERVVRLGIPQSAVPLIAEYGMWDEFVLARIHIEEAIEEAEGLRS